MAVILLVNDDPVQLHLLGSLLETEDWEICSCQSAEAALRVLCERQDIDALLVDLHMPGIDGWRFCRLLRSPEYSAFNTLPIIVMSATYSGADAEQITADLGANAFIALPVEPVRLRKNVTDVLRGDSSPAALRCLIIDENETDASLLALGFSAHGWVVHCAKSGEEGCRLVQELDPEVVLIDHALSDGPGVELLPKVKPPGSSTVVLLLSSVSDPDLALNAIRQGADAYVPKPHSPEYLLALCTKARRERSLLRVEDLLEERTICLRDSESRFRVLCEGLTDIVLVYDTKGIIRFVNDNGAKLLDWAPSDLIGQSLSLMGQIPEPSELPRHPSENNTFKREAVYVSRFGRQLEVDIVQQTILFEGQSHWMVVARDIGQQKEAQRKQVRLEQQLQQVEKMEAIGRLAGGVAHDVNNILTAILGHASVLSAGDTSSSLTQPSQVITKAVQRGKQLTSQLLGFAKPGKQHNVTMDIHGIIEEVLTLLDQKTNTAIHIEPSHFTTPLYIQGDSGQIHQVILNLALNAIEAMPHGGSLSVSSRTEMVGPDGVPEPLGLSPGPFVVVSVTDTGPGIDPGIQGSIFEPFFTTKSPGKGSGMGLAMVYGIVKNHQGAISVSSQLGCGTTMTVYFPQVEDPSIRESSSTTTPQDKGRILVVDDDECVRASAQEVLMFLGYDVSLASSGQSALNYVQKNHQQVDLILLDFEMPEMEGMECFRQLQLLESGIPVVFCTGHDPNGYVDALEKEGLAGIVQKPYDVTELSQVIARGLEQRTSQPTFMRTGEKHGQFIPPHT